MTTGRGGVVYGVLSRALGWISRLVPESRRSAWVEEWRAEVWHGLDRAPLGGRLRTCARVPGAVRDALAVRRAVLRADARGGPRRESLLGSFAVDVRLAARGLSRARGFTALAVLILALGIGLNTAVLTLARSALAGPLPFADAEHLVKLWERRPEQGRERNAVSLPDFVDWRDRTSSFVSMAAIQYTESSFTGVDVPRSIQGALVTGEFFPLLGVRPEVGRALGPGDERGERTVVLGHGLWTEAFGGDPSIVGRTVELDLEPYTVVGVMPSGFGLGWVMDFWAPLPGGADGAAADSRGAHRYEVVARLATGVALARAAEELDALTRSLESEYPETNTGHYAAVVPLREEMLDGKGSVLLLLTGAVALVLLVACVNVANMELVRSAARARDLALRAALGATRARLLRQLVVESLLLSAAAAALSVPVALASWRLLQSSTASGVTWVAAGPLEPAALVTAVGLAALTALLFGLSPALRASRLSVVDRLKEGAPRSGLGRSAARWQGAMVATQVGLAVALLAGAGLLTRSLLGLLAVDPGFDPGNVVTADVALPPARYPADAERIAFFAELERRTRSIPGVVAAGSTWILPMGDREVGRDFLIEGRTPAYANEWNTRLRVISGDYYEAMRIRVLRGRRFGAGDAADAPRVGIVNETAVRRFWPDGEPLGQRIRFGEDEPWMTIVGVVNDVRHAGFSQPPDAELYLPFAQSPVAFQTFVVRADASAPVVIDALRAEVRALDPDQPLSGVGAYEDRLWNLFSYRRELAGTVSTFALLALLLAGMGIYGVVSHTVLQRRHEFGIRLALGGTSGRVVGSVMRRGGLLIAVGTIGGLVLFSMGSGLVRGFLFEVGPFDPLTLVVSTGVLVAVAFGATYLPARAVTRVSPSESLRG